MAVFEKKWTNSDFSVDRELIVSGNVVKAFWSSFLDESTNDVRVERTVWKVQNGVDETNRVFRKLRLPTLSGIELRPMLVQSLLMVKL